MFAQFILAGIAFLLALASSSAATLLVSGVDSSSPLSLVVDAAGATAYIASYSGKIFSVNLATNVKTQLTPTLWSATLCFGIGLDATNSVIYIGGYNQLHKYPALTAGSTPTQLGSPTSGTFYPQAMLVAGSTMYIADTGNGGDTAADGKIWKTSLPLNSISQVTQLALTLNGNLYTPGAPKGMAFVSGSGLGTLYFVESWGNKLSKVNLDTGAVTANIITNGIVSPACFYSVAVNAAETYAYVGTWYGPSNSILTVDLSTNTFTVLDTATAVYGLNLVGTDLFATSASSLIKVSTIPGAPTSIPSSVPTPIPSSVPTPISNSVPTNLKAKEGSNLLGLIALITIIPAGACAFVFYLRKKIDKSETYKQESELEVAKVPQDLVGIQPC